MIICGPFAEIRVLMRGPHPGWYTPAKRCVLLRISVKCEIKKTHPAGSVFVIVNVIVAAIGCHRQPIYELFSLQTSIFSFVCFIFEINLLDTCTRGKYIKENFVYSLAYSYLCSELRRCFHLLRIINTLLIASKLS